MVTVPPDSLSVENAQRKAVPAASMPQAQLQSQKHGHIDGKVENAILFQHIFGVKDIGVSNFIRKLFAEFIQ